MASLAPFFFNRPAPPHIYTLSLHDALPISRIPLQRLVFLFGLLVGHTLRPAHALERSEEHTSELQSRVDLVCRLLLEKKKIDDRVGILVCQVDDLRDCGIYLAVSDQGVRYY